MAGAQFARSFEKLAKLQAGLKAVGSKEFKLALMKQLSIEAVHQVHVSFMGAKDPYDAAWKKSKLTGRRRGGLTLQDTRRLFNSFTTSYNSNTFRVGSRVTYAAIHNYGGTVHRKASTTTKRVVGRDALGRIKKGSKFTTKTFTHGASSGVIPKRSFLPETSKGLGRRWTSAMEPIANKVLRLYIKRQRGE